MVDGEVDEGQLPITHLDLRSETHPECCLKFGDGFDQLLQYQCHSFDSHHTHLLKITHIRSSGKYSDQFCLFLFAVFSS